MKKYDLDKAKIKQLYKQSNSIREIAEIYNVSKATMERYFADNNIKRRPWLEAIVMGAKKRRKTNNWSPQYRGGRYQRTDGYIQVLKKDNPMANPQGYVYEHRLVMSEKLGRPLTSKEIVHHLNGAPGDNRLENLFLTNRKDHDTHSFRKALQKRIRELEPKNRV